MKLIAEVHQLDEYDVSKSSCHSLPKDTTELPVMKIESLESGHEWVLANDCLFILLSLKCPTQATFAFH